MNDGLSSLESRVRALEQMVDLLEHRVTAIELVPAGASVEPVVSASIAAQPTTDSPPAIGTDWVSVVSLIGRTCVIVGGAYLLRALTESEALPLPVGVACGLAYAMVWLAMSDRAAARGRELSAAFYGLVATLIALPLIWEAVTRFRLVGAGVASVLLVAVTLAAVAVSARRRVQALAWITVVPAAIASVALTGATGAIVPFAIATIALGVATLWIGYVLDWVLLRWPVAIVADLTVLALSLGVSSRSVTDAPPVVIATQLLLLIGYLSSIVVRTLFRGRDVVPFEIIQGIASLAVGFGGAVYVAQTTMVGRAMLASLSLVCGVACYAIAFAFVARRQGLRQNFYFYTSLGLVLVLAGTGLLLHQAALLWATLAVFATGAAWRVGRLALTLHAAAYAIAAALASGLIAAATSALTSATAIPSPFPPLMLAVMIALCVCWSIPLSPAARSWGSYSRLPRLAIAIAFTWSAVAWIVSVTLAVIARATGPADPGLVATVRTAGLATTVVALANAGRFDRFREAAWLVYPVLAIGGVKLIAEDFARSRPATLFIALALYGSALIAASRVQHR